MPVRALLATVALASCAAPIGAPSLNPRAAEAIDPRVPVVNPVTDTVPEPALTARLAALVGEARAGDSAFEAALGEARRLADSAGASGGESWISAQQALSAAVAARAPTTRALGEIDALGAEALAASGSIATGNYLAIQRALGEVEAIDARQVAAIAAVQRRLGV